MLQRSLPWLLSSMLCLPLLASSAQAAGTLTPAGSSAPPVDIVDHHVEVVIDNGFARVEVTQTFHNDGEQAVEALYEFPLPRTASLSEMSIMTGEQSLRGEVVARDTAQSAYEEERDAGNQAGLVTKEGFQRFEFRIARVPAEGDVTVSFVYYQPLTVEDSVGRWVYPLAEGGTDESAFWSPNDQVKRAFSAHVRIKNAYPIEQVRVPSFDGVRTERESEGVWEAWIEPAPAVLDHDLVLYYRLPSDLPGRLEVVPYRADAEHEGTVMIVLTPGVDLPPVEGGADYVLVLDVSGSMDGKLDALVQAARHFAETLQSGDRLRIVKFSDTAAELGNAWREIGEDGPEVTVPDLVTEGGTNLYAGLQLALSFPEEGRTTHVVVVTDGVTNYGIVDPHAFDALVRERDVRVYGMLLGNSGNWPLMELITGVSGGAYEPVSTSDDVFARVDMLKRQITREALYDVDVSITGAGIDDLSSAPRKIFFGQQLVLFGHYARAGSATLQVKARFTGAEHTYSAKITLPAQARDNPELERLWAIDRVEQLEYERDMGLLTPEAAAAEMEQIGVAYQIVTDETAMVVLSDEAFDANGIARDNAARSEQEAQAQTVRMQAAPANNTVDSGAWSGGGYGGGSGGGGGGYGGGAVGAGDAMWLLMALLASCMLGRASRVRGPRAR